MTEYNLEYSKSKKKLFLTVSHQSTTKTILLQVIREIRKKNPEGKKIFKIFPNFSKCKAVFQVKFRVNFFNMVYPNEKDPYD